jgi:hypothetical protein
MTSRRYKKVRAAGQDIPPLDIQTMEFLQLGTNLIMHPVPFPADKAEAAWDAYREAVLQDWATQHHYIENEKCWAEKKFE